MFSEVFLVCLNHCLKNLISQCCKLKWYLGCESDFLKQHIFKTIWCERDAIISHPIIQNSVLVCNYILGLLKNLNLLKIFKNESFHSWNFNSFEEALDAPIRLFCSVWPNIGQTRFHSVHRLLFTQMFDLSSGFQCKNCFLKICNGAFDINQIVVKNACFVW